jgi:phosphocarrier protein HPr
MLRGDVVMKERKIKLNSQDVEEFVKIASKCDFDIDVFYNRVVIDAKSILGVLGLDFNKTLTVKYTGENPVFEKMLHKFAIAS